MRSPAARRENEFRRGSMRSIIARSASHARCTSSPTTTALPSDFFAPMKAPRAIAVNGS